MQKVSVVGVAIGGVIDIVATNLVAFPFVLYVMTSRGLLNLPKPEMTVQVMAAIKGSWVIYLTLGFLGCLCSVLGGYVAAVMARRAEVLNGALSAYLCLAFSIWGLAMGQEQLPTWLHVALLPLSPFLGALGGYLRLLQVRRSVVAPVPGAV